MDHSTSARTKENASGAGLLAVCGCYNHAMYVALVALWAAVGAVTPLTPAQQTQLDTAGDFTGQFDEGALYPLLQNAWEWQNSDEAGAVIPDYAAIRQSPAEYRGQLFLIEGRFAGRSKKIEYLARPGPWDDKLREWVVVVDSSKDEVAVAYLTHPPVVPTAGARVRLAVRFYKALSDKDINGKPTDYLLFVGHSATVVDAGRGVGGAGSGSRPLVLVLAILAAGWYLLRRALRAKPLRADQRRVSQADIDAEQVMDEETELELPDDPAQALDVLKHQHDDAE